MKTTKKTKKTAARPKPKIRDQIADLYRRVGHIEELEEQFRRLTSLEVLQAHWNKLPETSRFAMEGDHHLFDKSSGCYWIRERDASEHLNAKLEVIARMADDPVAFAGKTLAQRIRQMKEKV
jgi:hypothetical protein